ALRAAERPRVRHLPREGRRRRLLPHRDHRPPRRRRRERAARCDPGGPRRDGGPTMSFAWKRSYRGRLRAAILDWAGTTVDFGPCAPGGTFAAVFARRGVEIPGAGGRAPMGLAKRNHIAAIAAGERVLRRWEEVHGGPPADADIDAMYRE